MNLLDFKLQLFAEGGDGTGTGTDGSGLGVAEGGENGTRHSNGRRGLENVIYGKASQDDSTSTEDVTKTSPETKAQAFENLIKGEYKEEFAKRTQGIIDERFKKTKGMEDALKSHESILNMLSEKYGVDAKDVKALTKAIEEDETFYEKEAMEKGLSVEQLKEVKRLERENAEFRQAKEEAEMKANSDRIYAQWMEEGQALAEKYGIADFDFKVEVQNPDFTNLLANGVSLESAYKAVHIDDMIGGAMAKTADNVRTKMAQDIASRQARPSENGASSQNAAVFKNDVNKLSKADREEIDRRVARGEIISF